jgi:hypothetical protein
MGMVKFIVAVLLSGEIIHPPPLKRTVCVMLNIEQRIEIRNQEKFKNAVFYINDGNIPIYQPDFFQNGNEHAKPGTVNVIKL